MRCNIKVVGRLAEASRAHSRTDWCENRFRPRHHTTMHAHSRESNAIWPLCFAYVCCWLSYAVLRTSSRVVCATRNMARVRNACVSTCCLLQPRAHPHSFWRAGWRRTYRENTPYTTAAVHIAPARIRIRQMIHAWPRFLQGLDVYTYACVLFAVHT